MAARLEAKIPKRFTSPKSGEAGLKAYLDAFAQEGLRIMVVYPPWRPWKNPPKSGPRAGGKRLGNYGRSWAVTKRTKFLIEITNATEYGVYVGGKKTGAKGQRQAAALAARGWTSVTDAGPQAKKAADAKVKLYPR